MRCYTANTSNNISDPLHSYASHSEGDQHIGSLIVRPAESLQEWYRGLPRRTMPLAAREAPQNAVASSSRLPAVPVAPPPPYVAGRADVRGAPPPVPPVFAPQAALNSEPVCKLDSIT